MDKLMMRCHFLLKILIAIVPKFLSILETEQILFFQCKMVIIIGTGAVKVFFFCEMDPSWKEKL